MREYLASPTCWALFGGSLASTAVLTPFVIRLARWVGAVDRGGYRKIFHGSMPRMGGLAVALPFLAVCVLGMFGPTVMLRIMAGGKLDLIYLAVGCAIIVTVGVVDDIRGLRARTKLLFQTLAALFICATGNMITCLHIPLFGTLILPSLIGLGLTVLWIVGITNAFNLIDGVDGLASGVAFIAAAALAVIAAQNHAPFVCLLSMALAGSLLAFLLFNFHPAKIFLGDTGSMFLGFALATIALMGSHKSQAAVIFMAPILALGMPIFETLTSIVRRALRGRPLFVADQGHTHHRLLKRGFSQRQVAMTLYMASFLFMVSGVMFQILTDAQPAKGPWLPIALYVVTVLGLAWLAGYIRLGEVIQKTRHRRRNHLLSAFARYSALALSSDTSLLKTNEILRIIRRELKLRFLEVWIEDYEEMPLLIASSGRMSLLAECGRPYHASLVAPNGYVMDGEDALPAVDAFDEIRVQAANGYSLLIRHQYGQKPGEIERQDMVACLAHLFAQMKPNPEGYRPRAKIIPANAEAMQGKVMSLWPVSLLRAGRRG